MDDKVKDLILSTVDTMIEKCGNEVQIKNILKKHKAKVHFVPLRYRVFGGML